MTRGASLSEKSNAASPGPPGPTVEDFRIDPLFPRIENAMLEILASGKVVAPIDVFVAMGHLLPQDLEDWRFGRIPALERVVKCNLTKIGRTLRILRLYAHDLNLVPSHTAYVKWGKGTRTPLRFTKSGDRNVEAAWARHFVWPGKGPFQRPALEAESSPAPRSEPDR